MKKHRRSKGMIGFIEAIFVTVVLGTITVLFVSPNLPSITVGKAETIGRKYIIKSQQQGYLSSSDMVQLKMKLGDIGVKNITIKAANNKVKFGEDVDLVIEYDIEVKELNVDGSVFPKFETKTKRVKIDKSTISTMT